MVIDAMNELLVNLRKKRFGTLLKNDENIFISIDFSQD